MSANKVSLKLDCRNGKLTVKSIEFPNSVPIHSIYRLDTGQLDEFDKKANPLRCCSFSFILYLLCLWVFSSQRWWVSGLS